MSIQQTLGVLAVAAMGAAGCTLDTHGECAGNCSGNSGGSSIGADAHEADVSAGGEAGAAGGTDSQVWPDGKDALAENPLEDADACGQACQDAYDVDVYEEAKEDVADVVSEDVPDAADAKDAYNTDAQDAADALDAHDASDSSTPPLAPLSQFFMSAPCPEPPTLSYEATSKRLYLTCWAYQGNPHTLYRSSSPVPTPGTWEQVAVLNGYPTNDVPLESPDFRAITHTALNGFTMVNVSTGQVTSTVNYNSLTSTDPIYKNYKAKINNPSGAALIQGNPGKFCVATRNLATPFSAGTVLCTDYLGNGLINPANTSLLLTNAVDPTGVVRLNDSLAPDAGISKRFAVLASGDPASATPSASLDICAVPDNSCTPISLGAVAAQEIPQLPLMLGGASVMFALQKPGFALIGRNWVDGTTSYPSTPLNVSEAVASMNIFGEIALIGGSGIYDDPLHRGTTLFKNLNPGGWQDVLTTIWQGKAGPSVIAEGRLYTVVTVKDSNNNPKGEVHVADLNGL